MRRIILLSILAIISCSISVILSFSFFIFSYVGDPLYYYGCIVSVEQGYLGNEGDIDPIYEIDESVYASLYITTYHFQSLACQHIPLKNGEITQVGDYSVQVKDGVIIVNNEITIGAGESWRDSGTRFGLDPWFIFDEHLNLTNEGFVIGEKTRDGTITDFDREVLIVIGTHIIERRFDHIWGVSILSLIFSISPAIYLLVTILVTIFRSIKAKLSGNGMGGTTEDELRRTAT